MPPGKKMPPKNVWVDLLEGTAWIKNFPHLKRRRKHGRIIPKYVLPSTLSKLERNVVELAFTEWPEIEKASVKRLKILSEPYIGEPPRHQRQRALARLELARRKKKGRS